jgi:hypothetical protein
MVNIDIQPYLKARAVLEDAIASQKEAAIKLSNVKIEISAAMREQGIRKIDIDYDTALKLYVKKVPVKDMRFRGSQEQFEEVCELVEAHIVRGPLV